jgi:hypothetical protein
MRSTELILRASTRTSAPLRALFSMLNVIDARLCCWWMGGRRRLFYMRVIAAFDLAGIFTVIGAKCNPVPWQKGQTFTI